jgi:hypothetical protein
VLVWSLCRSIRQSKSFCSIGFGWSESFVNEQGSLYFIGKNNFQKTRRTLDGRFLLPREIPFVAQMTRQPLLLISFHVAVVVVEV